jgi:hypothetical protein
MKQGSTVCKHGEEPLECILCNSYPRSDIKDQKIILAALMAQVSQLLELTKCNSLAEVAGLVIELRKK